MIPLVDYADRHERLGALFDRSASFDEEAARAARDVLAKVQERGDEALGTLSERFDDVRPEPLAAPEEECAAAYEDADDELLAVIEEAADNVRRFHRRQLPQSWFADEGGGVILGQRVAPLERAGCYAPAGAAAYPSSVLMNVIPAQVAGVEEVVLCSPPKAEHGGRPHPLVLATAHLLGVGEVYAVGGAQAVGAMAYGTACIPGVDKIVGPGNAYVAAAKKHVFGRVDIDSIAGPSEVAVLADAGADAAYAAADLLAQAEHDPRASVLLATPSRTLAEAVRREIETQIADLNRRDTIERALDAYGALVVTPAMDEAVALVNELAPEHLEILTADPWQTMTHVRHAGALFLGEHAPVPVGDYYAGPNHVLPTGGTARHASPLGVHSFLRRQSVVSYSEKRLEETGPRIAAFAEAEGLDAHAAAVRRRLASVD
ncbi:MAG: histidinol dehydrogenase [Bacteroidetes bacterium QH_8_67_23]|nr:MAG: histidinol dehydrogenase [Bacteroidetes bacterium QH_8_67_23]